MHLIVGSLSETQQPPNTYLLSSIKGPFGTSGGIGIPYEIFRKPVLDLHAEHFFITSPPVPLVSPPQNYPAHLYSYSLLALAPQ